MMPAPHTLPAAMHVGFPPPVAGATQQPPLVHVLFGQHAWLFPPQAVQVPKLPNPAPVQIVAPAVQTPP